AAGALARVGASIGVVRITVVAGLAGVEVNQLVPAIDGGAIRVARGGLPAGIASLSDVEDAVAATHDRAVVLTRGASFVRLALLARLRVDRAVAAFGEGTVEITRGGQA